MLSDDGHTSVVEQAGIHDDAIARREPGDALADGLDDACSVRAEDSRLRDRGQALADPDVEVVHACCSKLDEHLACFWLWIRDVLIGKDLGSAVLVNSDRLHEAESSHDGGRAEAAATNLEAEVVCAAAAEPCAETVRYLRGCREPAPPTFPR